jgi:hypothetical protein
MNPEQGSSDEGFSSDGHRQMKDISSSNEGFLAASSNEGFLPPPIVE